MNRSTFFKTLGVALASVASGSALAAVANGRTRTLNEWLRDIRESGEKIMVIGSADAIEYFRGEIPKGFRGLSWTTGDGLTRFTIEHSPYRYDANGDLVSPYITEETSLGRRYSPNQAWLDAPTEIAFAAIGSTIHFAAYDRKTFRLIRAEGAT